MSGLHLHSQPFLLAVTESALVSAEDGVGQRLRDGGGVMGGGGVQRVYGVMTHAERG